MLDPFQEQSGTTLFTSSLWVPKTIETEIGISSVNTIPYEILKNPFFVCVYSSWLSENSQPPQKRPRYQFLNMNYKSVPSNVKALFSHLPSHSDLFLLSVRRENCPLVGSRI